MHFFLISIVLLSHLLTCFGSYYIGSCGTWAFAESCQQQKWFYDDDEKCPGRVHRVELYDRRRAQQKSAMFDVLHRRELQIQESLVILFICNIKTVNLPLRPGDIGDLGDFIEPSPSLLFVLWLGEPDSSDSTCSSSFLFKSSLRLRFTSICAWCSESVSEFDGDILVSDNVVSPVTAEWLSQTNSRFFGWGCKAMVIVLALSDGCWEITSVIVVSVVFIFITMLHTDASTQQWILAFESEIYMLRSSNPIINGNNFYLALALARFSVFFIHSNSRRSRLAAVKMSDRYTQIAIFINRLFTITEATFCRIARYNVMICRMITEHNFWRLIHLLCVFVAIIVRIIAAHSLSTQARYVKWLS